MSEIKLLCGISGSGKTTYANRYESMDYVKLSLDEMMYDFFRFDYKKEDYRQLADKTEEILKEKLVMLIKEDKNACVDMTFCKKSKRDEYRNLITSLGATYELIFFKASLKTLKDRIKKRNKNVSKSAYYVSNAELEKFYKGFEAPTSDENPTIIDQDKYLISIDLDSTFIDGEQNISEFSKKYVKRLERLGHHFIINTGRPMQSAVDFLKELKIHEPVIVNNGGSIVFFNDDYSAIEHNITFKLDLGKIKEFLERVKGYLTNGALTSTYDFYGYDIDTLPWWVKHESNMVTFHNGDIVSNLVSNPFRGEIRVKHEYLDIFNEIKAEYEEYFKFLHWGCFDGSDTFEISSLEGGKGNAMMFLADYLHISPLNTIAFGDQLNDLDMLKKAKIGVAMCNGNKELFKFIDNVTEFDNNHDGVVRYLDKIFKLL